MIVEGIASVGPRKEYHESADAKDSGTGSRAGSIAGISDTAVTLKGQKSSLLLAGISHHKKWDI
jgi:hypothetical protein